jgi:hypothetical protein
MEVTQYFHQLLQQVGVAQVQVMVHTLQAQMVVQAVRQEHQVQVTLMLELVRLDKEIMAEHQLVVQQVVAVVQRKRGNQEAPLAAMAVMDHLLIVVGVQQQQAGKT